MSNFFEHLRPTHYMKIEKEKPVLIEREPNHPLSCSSSSSLQKKQYRKNTTGKQTTRKTYKTTTTTRKLKRSTGDGEDRSRSYALEIHLSGGSYDHPLPGVSLDGRAVPEMFEEHRLAFSREAQQPMNLPQQQQQEQNMSSITTGHLIGGNQMGVSYNDAGYQYNSNNNNNNNNNNNQYNPVNNFGSSSSSCSSSNVAWTASSERDAYALGLVQHTQFLEQQRRQNQLNAMVYKNEEFNTYATPIDRALDDRRSFEKVCTSIDEFTDLEDRQLYLYAAEYFNAHPDYWNVVHYIITHSLIFTYPEFEKTIQITLEDVQEFTDQIFPAYQIVCPPRVNAEAHGTRIEFHGIPTTPRQMYYFYLFFFHNMYEYFSSTFMKEKVLRDMLQQFQTALQ